MEGRILSDVVVQKSTTLLALLVGKVRRRWFRRNALLGLNLHLDGKRSLLQVYREVFVEIQALASQTLRKICNY